MGGDSSEWVINGEFDGPAFILARVGYDVWLGNNRGNIYSLNHTTINLETNKSEFFNFDFEDIGLKDLPAEIDFALKHTGVKKLTLFGHSMGATSSLIGMSYLPFYFASKVNLAIFLGPASRLTNIKDKGFRDFAKHYLNTFEFFYVDVLGNYQAFTPNWID